MQRNNDYPHLREFRIKKLPEALMKLVLFLLLDLSLKLPQLRGTVVVCGNVARAEESCVAMRAISVAQVHLRLTHSGDAEDILIQLSVWSRFFCCGRQCTN